MKQKQMLTLGFSPRIVTHSGAFHADDVLAIAILSFIYPGIDLVRSRDPEVIAGADIAVDVGGIYDPAQGRFDHHQREFSIKRDSGTGYASAGLVWKAFGAQFIALAHPGLAAKTVTAIECEIDRLFIRYVDQSDTGEARPARGSFGFSAMIGEFNPTWQEDGENPATQDAAFVEAVVMAQRVLKRMVANDVANAAAAEQVRRSAVHADGKVLLLEKSLPWADVVCNEKPDVLFVAFPEADGWLLRTVPERLGSFASRKLFPEQWWGATADELAQLADSDATFCHRSGFIARSQSREGVLRLAHRALT